MARVARQPDRQCWIMQPRLLKTTPSNATWQESRTLAQSGPSSSCQPQSAVAVPAVLGCLGTRRGSVTSSRARTRPGGPSTGACTEGRTQQRADRQRLPGAAAAAEPEGHIILFCGALLWVPRCCCALGSFGGCFVIARPNNKQQQRTTTTTTAATSATAPATAADNNTPKHLSLNTQA